MPTTKNKQALQAYFPKKTYILVKFQAQEEGKSISKWLQDVAEKELKKSGKKKHTLADMPDFTLSGTEKDLSQRIDEIVYDNVHSE